MDDINHLLLKIKNKTLLVVFPHPDDETMATGGLIMAAKAVGWKVVVVCLTKGGAGRIFIRASGRTLKEIREKELARACRMLGVDEVVVEDMNDGRLRVESKKMAKWLNGQMVKYQPGLVVTYDPSGFYGHPDHIALSKVLLSEIKNQKSNIKDEAKLLFVAVPPILKEKLPLRGMVEVKKQMVEATHELDLGWNWLRKWRAAKVHASQGLGKGMKFPLWLYLAKFHYEYYHLVNPRNKYWFKYIDYRL